MYNKLPMNLILFNKNEIGKILPFSDKRAWHIKNILNKDSPGDTFESGIINTALGIGRLEKKTNDGWIWSFSKTFNAEELAKPYPVTLLIGTPRPPVAKRILRDMSAIGLSDIIFCSTDLNEKSYLTSKLWRDGLWKDAVIDGAMQGKSIFLPEIHTALTLNQGIEITDSIINTDRINHSEHVKIAFDNAEDCKKFNREISEEIKKIKKQTGKEKPEIIFAVGPERGWSNKERDLFDKNGFTRLRLGERVLRSETACTLSAGLILNTFKFL